MRKQRLATTIVAFLLTFALTNLGGLVSSRAATGSVGGYTQLRYESDFHQNGWFAIRRMKMWKKGPVSGAPGWFYKVQLATSTKGGGSVHLQEAYAEFRGDGWQVILGQMVPPFVLQQIQADREIPVLERAAVSDVLHPAVETDCRDIGIMLALDRWLAPGHLELGFFNGAGANRLVAAPGATMLVGRFLLRLRGQLGQGHVGVSFVRRRLRGVVLPEVLGPSLSFTGLDRREGVEWLWRLGRFTLQVEALRARLGPWKVSGSYELATWRLLPGHQLVAYHDVLQRPQSVFVKHREVGIGYLWQAPENRVRCWAFLVRPREAASWPLLKVQLQVLLL